MRACLGRLEDGNTNRAKKNRYILKAMSEFGPGGQNQLYCSLFYYNGQYDKTTGDVRGDIDSFQTVFNSEVTKPFWRPYSLSMGENQWVESAFTHRRRLVDLSLWHDSPTTCR